MSACARLRATARGLGERSARNLPAARRLRFLLAIDALERYARFLGDEVTVEYPTRSGTRLTLTEIAADLRRRLISLFLVDPDGRRLMHSLALDWRDVPVAERFERAYGTVAAVEYNVRAMARAEARYGLGRRADNLLYLHLGESLGVAYLVDGLAFRQGTHGVSELGHHQVRADGPRCSCGAVGCLEAVLGREYLLTRIREAGARSPVLAKLVRRATRPLEVLDSGVQADDPVAIEISDEVTGHLSGAIAMSINIFSPSRVALGGALASAPKDFFGRLQEETLTRVSRILRDQVTIDRASIGRYPGVLGAGTVALDRLFYRDHPPTPAVRGSRRIPPQWATAATART